jgi:hypothetical protein
VPAWIPLTGVFVPDFLWIALSRAGIELTKQAEFFDDWSHSLLMIVVWAMLFAFLFRRHGREVLAVAWFALFSHFLLDMPVHPKFLALYPYSTVHIGIVESHGSFVLRNWLFELCVVGIFCGIYARFAWRYGLRRNLMAATRLSATSGCQQETLLKSLTRDHNVTIGTSITIALAFSI